MSGGIRMLRWMIYLFLFVLNGAFLLSVFNVWTNFTALWVMVIFTGIFLGTFEVLHRLGKLTDVKKGES